MGGVKVANVLRNSDSSHQYLRTKWKSKKKKQIARIREEGRCFRCEQNGCKIKIDRLLSAKKQKSKGHGATNVTLTQLDSNIYEAAQKTMSDVELESEKLTLLRSVAPRSTVQ